jgi:hypothetical protein
MFGKTQEVDLEDFNGAVVEETSYKIGKVKKKKVK